MSNQRLYTIAALILATVAHAASHAGARAGEPMVDFRVDPPQVTLRGPVARHTLLVTAVLANGRKRDAGGEALFRSETPRIVRVDREGVVRPVADGMGRVSVQLGSRSVRVAVRVRESASPREFSFLNDIMPILDKAGCNGAGCHGKAEGQAGFKLSVFNSDPRADYAAITHASRGRRVFPASADQSLLLLKAAGRKPHGGGVRIPQGTPEHQTLRDWIAAGVPYGDDGEAQVVRVEVSPRSRVLAPHARQQLRVIAHYSDGRTRDVTRLAQYQSNNPAVATISRTGRVKTLDRPGQVALRVGFMNQFAMFQALLPRPGSIDNYPQFPERNFIDRLVHRKLRALNILPSPLADDAEYLRRVHLDIIGRLPAPEEVEQFLSDKRPDRRRKIVDQLLAREEYADYWALKWADLLQVERKNLGHKAAYAYYKWIRDSFKANKPYDQFVREILTAEGALVDVPQAYFYKVDGDPGKVASRFAQTFLGLRIACAQCHHHPTDVWTQTDYYGMQAFFTQLKRKGSPRGEVVWVQGNPTTRHPRSKQVVHPHPLGTAAPETAPTGDRRRALADWLTRPDNPWFARNLANRLWAHFMGRGLIEPVDDLRATNPPSNPELLDALTQLVRDKKYDLHEVIRTITQSRAYQLTSLANETNRLDQQNYSRANLRPLEAEVLLDAVCQVTGVPEKFDGVPAGYRATQLWDSGVSHYFLKLFGRPIRKSACVCERLTEPNVAQALHLMNSPAIHAKLKHAGGALARLAAEGLDDAQLVRRLYLRFFSRPPSAAEAKKAIAYLQSVPNRRQACEDLAWSMLCSIEFIFRH